MTWPKSGSMRGGRCFEHQTLELPTDVSASSSSRLLPTATCSDVYTGRLASTQQKPGSMHSVTLPQAVTRMLPTPTARLGESRGAQAKRYTNPERSNDLDDAVAWLGESSAQLSDGGNEFSDVPLLSLPTESN